MRSAYPDDRASALLTRLSHDLRQPLSALELQLSACTRSDEIAGALAALDCVNVLLQLVTELARVETRGRSLPRPFAVNDLLRQSKARLHQYLELSNVSVRIVQSEACVEGDFDACRHLVPALMLNLAQSGARRLLLGVSRRGGEAHVDVVAMGARPSWRETSTMAAIAALSNAAGVRLELGWPTATTIRASIVVQGGGVGV